MPAVSSSVLSQTRAAADHALEARVITPEIHAQLTDGEITSKESAKATFMMARKGLFANADRKAACTALAKAIEAQMSAQSGGVAGT